MPQLLSLVFQNPRATTRVHAPQGKISHDATEIPDASKTQTNKLIKKKKLEKKKGMNRARTSEYAMKLLSHLYG